MKSLKGSQPQELSDELQVKLMIRGEVHLSLEWNSNEKNMQLSFVLMLKIKLKVLIHLSDSLEIL